MIAAYERVQSARVQLLAAVWADGVVVRGDQLSAVAVAASDSVLVVVQSQRVARWPGLNPRARAGRACRVESGPVDQAGQARLVTPGPVRVDVARQPLLRGYSAPERRSVVI